MIHELKCWPVFFDDIAAGAKKFEIRKNDRDFRVGDKLILFKYDPEENTYTQDFIQVSVTYTICLDGLPGMPDGFIGMGIELLKNNEEETTEYKTNSPVGWDK